MLRGRSGIRWNCKGKKSRSKSNSKGFDISKYKDFIYHKIGHFKKDFLDKAKWYSSSIKVMVASDEEGYESVGALDVRSS